MVGIAENTAVLGRENAVCKAASPRWLIAPRLVTGKFPTLRFGHVLRSQDHQDTQRRLGPTSDRLVHRREDLRALLERDQTTRVGLRPHPRRPMQRPWGGWAKPTRLGDGEEQCHLDNAAEDEIDPGLTEDRHDHGHHVEQADNDVG